MAKDGFLAAYVKTRYFFAFQIYRTNIGRKLLPNVYFGKGVIELLPHLYQKNPKALKKAKELITAPLEQHISIEGKCVCLHGENLDFTGSTTVIMAHWDPEQTIDPYVEQLCMHFKSIGFKVIIASAQPIKEDIVLCRWKNFSDAIIYRTCDGYHFTSWKAALTCFPSLYSCKELILTNDSYFGPMSSFEPMHKKMEQVTCDFWGISYSEGIAPHLQSFYIVIKNNVLNSACFKIFIDAISLEANREKAIAFEVSFTLWLAMHGFIAGAYCKNKSKYLLRLNQSYYFFKDLLECGVPLIKRENLYNGDAFLLFLDYKNTFQDESHWYSIHNYLLRIGSMPVTLSSFSMRRALEDNEIIYRQYEAFPFSILQNYTSLQSSALYSNTKNDKIAIAVHCYYSDSLHTLIPYLKNIPKRAHLYITTDTKEKKEQILSQLEQITFEKVEILICPNVGWDMAPFFVGLKEVLPCYEYILKLHIKKSTHMKNESGALWREALYSSLLGTQEDVEKLLGNLEMNTRLGVIAPPNYPPYALPIQGPNHELMNKILATKNLSLPVDACIDFPVGGMFWCRSEVLAPWLELNLSYDDFEATNSKQRDGTLAHALERLIFWGCGIKNMQWGRVFNKS